MTETGRKISALWIVVLFNMVFADILNFVTPGADYADELQVTQELLLIFAVLLEVPIAMVFLSRLLKPAANRVTNIVACAITIPFTIAGGTLNLHYVFFATVEVVCMVLIVRYSWRWRDVHHAAGSPAR